MNLVQRIAINTGWQIVAHLVGLLTSLASLVLLTRYLGDRGFGEYVTIITFGSLVVSFSDLGLSLFITREHARHGSDATGLVHNALGLRLSASMAIVLLVSLGSAFLPYTTTLRLGISLFSLTAIFVSLSSILASVFQASLQMGRVAVGDVLHRLVALGVIVWIIATHRPLVHLIGGLVAAHALQFGVVLMLSRPLLAFRLGFDFPVWRRLLKNTMPFAVMAVLAFVYARADMVILSLFFDPSSVPAVGIYGAAYRVLDALLMLPVAFLGSVFPSLVQSVGHGPRSGRIPGETFRVLATLAFPIVLGGMLLAHPIMAIIAGPEFVRPQSLPVPIFGSLLLTPSPAALQMLLVALFFMLFGFLNGLVLVAAGRERTLLRIFAGVVPLNILLSMILIPRYSFVGAALATVLTEMLGVIWSTRAVAKAGIVYRWAEMMKPCLAAVGMTAALAATVSFTSDVIVLFLLGGAVYVSILYLIGGIPIALVESLFTRKLLGPPHDARRGP